MKAKKSKQVIFVILSFALIYGLLACGSDDDAPPEAVTVEETSTVLLKRQRPQTVETTAPAEPIPEAEIEVEVREPTTVQEAQAVIDLRSLSLPTEIQAMERSDIGYLSFYLGGDVASTP